MRHIAIYGKGGVGKTTLAANLAAALAEAGKRVLLVGCDLKAGTGTLVHGSQQVPMLLDCLKDGKTLNLADIILSGYRGIACIEVGDSLAEEECATRSIARALEVLRELRVVEELNPDHIFYDMPGAIGCGGLPPHLFGSRQQLNFIMASGDLMSFYAANSFIRGVSRQSGAYSTAIVGNALTGSFEEAFVADFARQVKVPVAGLIPRSLVARHCELYGKTVIEAAPHSGHAQVYRKLARQIMGERFSAMDSPVQPLSVVTLRSWAKEWGDRLGELEFGILKDGAGI